MAVIKSVKSLTEASVNTPGEARFHMKERQDDQMEIRESAEDYLETILVLKERTGQVRSIDIATEMSYTKPSISVAMKKLRENGFIEMDKDGFITLTASGYEIASNIYNRHKVLTNFFVSLGVNAKVAAEDACKIEHDLSEETFEKIREHALNSAIHS